MINPLPARLPVLVVGGGLAGLTSALLLASQGTKVILVEKHAGSSPHPRATGFTQRSLEVFRSLGIEDAIKAVSKTSNQRPRRTKVESLAGPWQEESQWTPPAKGNQSANPEYSPCQGAGLAQDALEPLLRQFAQKRGADIRFNTKLISFTQNGNSVTACLQNTHGEEYEITAAYMIAADGHRSPVREALQIGRTGLGKMKTLRSVLFRADLEKYLDAGISQFEITHPDFSAFLTTYRDGRWVLIFEDDIERDTETLLALIKKAIGRDDVAVEIITTGRWELSALIADTFTKGRVFLVGDTAHTLPPSRGGYGANTGIEDAHNLCWKLSAVLQGNASPDLLNSYDEERRPIAWLRHDQIFARPDYSHFAQETKPENIIEDDAMELGQRYNSSAIAGTDKNLPLALKPDQWAGQPGTRAPHVWINRNGETISTLDLFSDDWVLLTRNPEWKLANETSLSAFCLNEDFFSENEEDFSKLFGLSKTGAILIRPDGYIAWRTEGEPGDSMETLYDTLI